MRVEFRSGLILAIVALGGTLASCADVLGLDEPTVREGAAGGTTTSAGPGSTSIGSTGGPGTGGAATSSGGGGATSGGGGGGAGGCGAPADCDDENPCTTERCNDGACSTDPIPDGPLIEDLEDCRTIACVGGEVSDVANDAEDPGDVNPPCETTICQGGAPTPMFASEGTSCGPDPQVCNGTGLCIGCDPSSPDSECGAATMCAAPTCLDPGVCDPGYFPASTNLADPTNGDCQDQTCTGSSAAPVSVADDTDVPPDLVCGDRGCSLGSPTTTTLPAGTLCVGQVGVCDGLGTAAGNCRVCQNTTADMLDLGCTAAAPSCDGPVGGFGSNCRECVENSDCVRSEVGYDCLKTFVCGCNNGIDCDESPSGEWCFGGLGVCGCQSQADCNDATRGDDCILLDAICGCNDSLDCQQSPWGSDCIDGSCGCFNFNACGNAMGARVCSAVTDRCE